MTILGIPVAISPEDGKYVVTDDEVHMYGVGSTEEGAIQDYKSSVMEYYEELVASRGELGTILLNHLEYLESRLEDYQCRS